jgi:type IV pilus assembly protein PilN
MYSLDVNFLKDRQLQTTAKSGAPLSRASNAPISWREQLPLIIGGGVGLTLAALTGLAGLLVNMQMQKTENSIKELEAEINQLNAKAGQVQEVEQKIQALDAESQALVTVFNQIKPWSPLLQELRRQVPANVSIESIEEVPIPADPATQEPAKLTVKIQGYAADYESVNNFLLTLQSSEFIQANKVKIDLVEKKEVAVKLDREIPDGELQFPQVVAYTISFERSPLPASQLLVPLSRNGAVGLVTRIKTLEQKGVLKL